MCWGGHCCKHGWKPRFSPYLCQELLRAAQLQQGTSQEWAKCWMCRWNPRSARQRSHGTLIKCRPCISFLGLSNIITKSRGQAATCILSQFWGPEVHTQGVRRAGSIWSSEGQTVVFLPASGGGWQSWRSLACEQATLPPAFTGLSLLCVSSSFLFSLFNKLNRIEFFVVKYP